MRPACGETIARMERQDFGPMLKRIDSPLSGMPEGREGG
jgi:hypothetical protein